jgi:hypothetical protein
MQDGPVPRVVQVAPIVVVPVFIFLMAATGVRKQHPAWLPGIGIQAMVRDGVEKKLVRLRRYASEAGNGPTVPPTPRSGGLIWRLSNWYREVTGSTPVP